MKLLKITIFGSSVAVRIRPPKEYPNNKNYHILLEEALSEKYPNTCVIIKNYGFTRATILEIYDRLETYLYTFPHFFVLNIGVPDASTREIPYWYAQIIRNPEKNLFSKLFSFIHSKFIKPFNPFFVRIRGKKTWIKAKIFRQKYEQILQRIKKDTNAKVICLPINPTTDRVEKIIPGSRDSYKKFNSIIKEICEKYGGFYVDLDDLEPEIHVPDGIHFSYEGHSEVAKRILKIIEQNYA